LLYFLWIYLCTCVFFCKPCRQCVYFVSDSAILRFFLTLPQNRRNSPSYVTVYLCDPWLVIEICGRDSKNVEDSYIYGLLLWVRRLPRPQRLPPSPTDTGPQVRLPRPAQPCIEYRKLTTDLSACGKRGIQYTERGAIEYACNYMYKFVRIFSSLSCAISIRR
jgi:hypothetical protein